MVASSSWDICLSIAAEYQNCIILHDNTLMAQQAAPSLRPQPCATYGGAPRCCRLKDQAWRAIVSVSGAHCCWPRLLYSAFPCFPSRLLTFDCYLRIRFLFAHAPYFTPQPHPDPPAMHLCLRTHMRGRRCASPVVERKKGYREVRGGQSYEQRDQKTMDIALSF